MCQCSLLILRPSFWYFGSFFVYLQIDCMGSMTYLNLLCFTMTVKWRMSRAEKTSLGPRSKVGEVSEAMTWFPPLSLYVDGGRLSWPVSSQLEWKYDFMPSRVQWVSFQDHGSFITSHVYLVLGAQGLWTFATRHPMTYSDPLLCPQLVFYLRERQVNALILPRVRPKEVSYL